MELPITLANRNVLIRTTYLFDMNMGSKLKVWLGIKMSPHLNPFFEDVLVYSQQLFPHYS